MNSNDSVMHYVGFCRICGTGPLGVRRCGACEKLAVVCDECDAVWETADFSQTPRVSEESDIPCSNCEASLFDGDSRWATMDEIKDCDWLTRATDGGQLELQSGKPLVAGEENPAENDIDEVTDLPTDAGG